MNLSFLREATSESIAAALWYDDQRLGLGDEFIVELEAGIAAIRANPHSMPELETYRGRHSIRRHLLQTFSIRSDFYDPR